MEIALIAVGLMAAYLVYLKLQVRAQQQEFAEFKRSVVMVPLPKKKQSPWIAVFAISTFILALAVLLLALKVG
ncbi:MAG: hypothetical protein RMN25_11280 [Anaerolineae bacterium]|nr:hypothetical protein [Thermoflexales bacterium]MDW8408351.1 hypothetical protein [Anaerolineae bacterium]